MNHVGRSAVAVLLAAVTALARAAGDDPDLAEQARQATTDRKELAKLAAYGDATGDAPNWSRVLHEFREHDGGRFERGEKLAGLAVERDADILVDAERLDKVLADPVALPDVDPAAKALSAALKALAPISHELLTYGQSRGYLADKEAKAHALNRPYMDALQAAADAQERLADRLGARDLRLVATAFSRAPKDSVLYYAAGMTYYGKRAAMDARALMHVPENTTVLGAFQASLEHFAAMSAGWEKEMAKDRPQGCVRRMMQINFFLGSGRQVVDRLRSGEYARRAKKYGEVLTAGRRGGLEADMMAYVDNYANLVDAENQQLC